MLKGNQSSLHYLTYSDLNLNTDLVILRYQPALNVFAYRFQTLDEAVIDARSAYGEGVT